MYAMLDYDKKTVIACIPPTVDLTLTEIKEEVNGRILIKVTLENGPAYIPGEYINGKFYSTKELING